MASALNFTPGYVREMFSYGRSELYQAVVKEDKFARYHRVGYFSELGVRVLCNASRLIGQPLRIIENLAFTVMNLFGVLIKGDKYKENLNYSAKKLTTELFKLPFVPIFVYAEVFWGVWGGNRCLPREVPHPIHFSNIERAKFYRMRAIRKFGHKQMKKMDNLVPRSFSRDSKKKEVIDYMYSEGMRQFYQRLSEATDFNQFYKSIEGNFVLGKCTTNGSDNLIESNKRFLQRYQFSLIPIPDDMSQKAARERFIRLLGLFLRPFSAYSKVRGSW